MSVITISRQFGAGGKTLGEMISKALGYTFVDDEIIYQVAKKGKVSTDWVKSIEKEAGGDHDHTSDEHEEHESHHRFLVGPDPKHVHKCCRPQKSATPWACRPARCP